MPIHYFNPQRSYFLTTNYKVWFSTLEVQPGLRRVDVCRVMRNVVERQAAGGFPNYLLTRNPYTRLESFFRDKFRQHPVDVRAEEHKEWQHCQQLFFGALAIPPDAPCEAVRVKLLGASFDEFLAELPQVANLDGHITPQCGARHLLAAGQAATIAFDRYIRTEAEYAEDRKFLTDAMGIDTSIVRNNTREVQEAIVWNSSSRAIANAVYRTDFELFNYPMLAD
jgi:hypothetical protein